MKRSVLSKRLQMLADMVTPGNRVADVGCDHGYLSIYLVQEGICPKGLAMDVRKGPLASAKAHIEEAGLGDYIKVRLSDGLEAYEAGEADTLVCAGMGGRLMEKILTDSMGKVRQMRELILQPQSELREFRIFLRKAGFVITGEDAIYQEGKYYFVIKAVPRHEEQEFSDSMGAEGLGQELSGSARAKQQGIGQESSNSMECTTESWQLYDAYGKFLLEGRHPVLLAYLVQRSEYLCRLQTELSIQDSEKARRRLAALGRELTELESALSFYSNGQ